MSISENTLPGAMSGTSAVAMFTAVAKSVIRNIVVRNEDSAPATVTISIGGASPVKITLQSGDHLTWDDILVLQTGQSITGVLDSPVTLANPTFVITYAEVS